MSLNLFFQLSKAERLSYISSQTYSGLPIYGGKVAQMFKEKRSDVPPPLFSISNNAYHNKDCMNLIVLIFFDITQNDSCAF